MFQLLIQLEAILITHTHKNYLVDGKLGAKLTYNGTLENYYTRFLSRPQNDSGYYNLTNGTTYNISYTLVNFGSEDVTIQISQIPSENNYTTGVLSSWYTVEAYGGKTEFTLTYIESRTSSTIANLITGFVVKGSYTDFAFGFEMAIEAVS